MKIVDGPHNVLGWVKANLPTRRRKEFHAHFGATGRADYRDTVPDTCIRMHSVNMTASTFEPRVYLLYTGVETIEEFKHAVAWLAMQDRGNVVVLY